jgi:hypothetical protein
MCPVDLLGSGRFSYSMVWFHISLFRSTVVIIGDGCYFGALVLWGLNTTTSRLSTTMMGICPWGPITKLTHRRSKA